LLRENIKQRRIHHQLRRVVTLKMLISVVNPKSKEVESQTMRRALPTLMTSRITKWCGTSWKRISI